MRYLLDTQALYWLADPAYGVPAHVRDELSRRDARLLVSSVSAFEIATKVRLGKFADAAWLLDEWAEMMAGFAAQEVPVRSEHGLVAGRLDWSHRDPFDRLLVAQATVDVLTLVTADPAMLAAPGIDLLPW